MTEWNLDAELQTWQKMPPEELWQIINGDPNDHHLHGLAEYRDSNLELSSWSWLRDGREPWWDIIPDHRRVPLQPRHHQLVGLLKIMSWICKGQGGMIADEVGVGKTGQLLMSIALRNRLIKQYQQSGKYPPQFGES